MSLQIMFDLLIQSSGKHGNPFRIFRNLLQKTEGDNFGGGEAIQNLGWGAFLREKHSGGRRWMRNGAGILFRRAEQERR